MNASYDEASRERPSRGTVIVRPVARTDYPQWLELWNGYNAFYGRSDSTALSADVIRTTWERFFDAYEPVEAIVAEIDGDLVGLAHYLLHRSTIQIEPTCYLQDLFTKENARNRGVGKALIEALYAAAIKIGLTRVYWQTHETNETAMKLYDAVAEKTGFVVYRHLV